MSEQQSLFSVKPIITYPREAQIGKSYLMTIDLQPEEGFEWQYDEEEYPIYCSVNSDVFSSQPVGDPVIVLHRFGGSYGEARFLLTADSESGQGNIKVVLINAWGVSIKVLELEQIRLLSGELTTLGSGLTVEVEKTITDSVSNVSKEATSKVPTLEEEERKIIEAGRAVILTNLPVEYSTVRTYLAKLREEQSFQGTIYERGEFIADGRVWDVGIIEVDGASFNTSLEVKRAIAYFNPDIILVVGIAGGIKDVSLGDVVVSSKLYKYEQRRVERIFKSNSEINLYNFRLIQQAKIEARKLDWLKRLSSVDETKQEVSELGSFEATVTQNIDQNQSFSSHILDSNPRVYVAPIVIGEDNILLESSELVKSLQDNYLDAIAFEIERINLLEAVYANQQAPMMIIRGISDLLGNKIKMNQSSFQEIASRHASTFAFEILAKFQKDKNRNSTSTSANIETRLNRFAQNIQPSRENIQEANQQANYIVERLKSKISMNEQFKVRKVLKAGSYARRTSLRPINTDGSDIDLFTYFTGQGATRKDFPKLRDFIYEQLHDIYPNGIQKSFTTPRGTVRVELSSGLKIDVVPIIEDNSQKIRNGGWFPYKNEWQYANSWQFTSVTCHNQFVTSRTEKSKAMSDFVSFNKLVRLMKWWNNRQKQLRQSSILCELITAAVFDAYGVTNEWQSSFRQVFSFLLEHQFLKPIVFDDFYDSKKLELPSNPVIVLDPANSENNITRNWTERTRLSYLNRVQNTYDLMLEAKSYELDNDSENAVAMWCKVFGDSFRSLSERS